MARHAARTPGAAWPARIAGALLCLTVAYVHVRDQGGVPGVVEPFYLGVGYHLLEIGAVVAVVLLLAGALRLGWLLAVGVGLGPLLGYVLSRVTGLPGYVEDIGHWTEPLGLASLGIETALLLLAVPNLLRSLRRRPAGDTRDRDR